MSKEKDADTITELGEDGKLHNITTKAGRLAMELASEKKEACSRARGITRRV